MKTIIKMFSLIVPLLFLATTINFAQPTISYKGKFKFFKGLTKLNVQYDYDNMSVEKFKNEQDFLYAKMLEENNKKSGSGNIWIAQWVANRKSFYEPTFESFFNMFAIEKGLEIGDFPDSPYTLLLKTIHTKPGWDKGNIFFYDYQASPHIDVEIWFVETSNKENVLAKMSMRVHGYKASRDVRIRLQSAYEDCGRYTAKYLKKKKFLDP